jgi:hypothetical protein
MAAKQQLAAKQQRFSPTLMTDLNLALRLSEPTMMENN